MIGQTISHYSILEKLGEGGMGVVYKAHDTRLDRTVALKFLTPALSASGHDKERFIHEARAASTLEHPNICTIHEIDETETGQIYIVMPAYEGEPLNTKIAEGPLKFEDAIDIALQIADGLQASHEQGIVHRDIKGSNIFITRKGNVKIMDFGLALRPEATALTKSGATVGTVPYMSPEQARGEKVDNRTDIWSLGVLLYEMIAGKHPFPGTYPEAVVYSILNTEPEPLTGIRTGVPVELEHVINKAIAKDRDERYRHTDELATDLRRIRTAMQTGRTRTVQAAAPLSGRKRFVRSSLWASLLIVIGLIAGVVFFQRTAMIPFAERDWILIADFENHTGDELFDKSLHAAFSVSIGQSRYVNVFPQRRINETLRRMMKSDVRRIDDATAREIALREGIDVILVPAISRIGERYVLTGTLQNPSTGMVYSSEMVYAQDLDNILNALDELGRKLRRQLGESRQSISRHSKPLVLVTTASIEALKQYSLGVESLIRTNFEDAKMYYENALRIDSSFTSAKASLGVLHFDNFDREKGKKLLSEVVGETDNVTEREKYDILSYYSAMVKEDLEEAVGYLRTQLALYPDHERAYHNLGVYYFRLGRYRESAEVQRKALRLNPERMLTYDNLNRLYLYHLAELDSAIALCRQQISVNPNHTRAYENLGWAYLGKSNLNRAAEAFEKALELNPRFILALYRLGHSLRMMERYEEALWPFRRIIELDPEEVWAHYQLGVVYQLMGNDEPARTSFERFRQSAEEWVREEPDNASGHIALGLVLTRLGRTDDGWSAGERAIELDPDLHFEIARLLAVQGRTGEALDRLERVTARGYLIWARTHPDLHLLYDEPRFTELINRVVQ